MKKLLVWLSKKMSKISLRTIWVLLAIIIIPIFLVPFFRDGSTLNCVGRFLVDVFSPVSMRNVPYGNPCCDVANDLGFASALAYAMGIILISGIVIPIITNYLRTLGDRFLDGTLDNYTWMDHTLFLGFDEMMMGTLQKVLKSGRKVVIAVPEGVRILRTRLAGMLTSEEMKCLEFVQCNTGDEQDLEKRARVGYAKQIFIIGQSDDTTHDASNLKSLNLISNIKERVCERDCYIYIRNQASLSLIQRQGWFEKSDVNNLLRRSMPFNFHLNIAERLLAGFESEKKLMTLDYQNDRRNLASCPGATAHLVILGMTEMGMALARETLMMMHYPDHRVKITMVDDNAREEMFYFIGRYKELFKLCSYSYMDLDKKEEEEPHKKSENGLLDVEFEFVKSGVAHPKLMQLIEEWATDDNQILTLVVCTNDSPKNMATALYLPRTLLEGENPIQVWVYQHGDDSLKEFCQHNQYKGFHTFSPSEYASVETADSITISLVETVANVYRKLVNKKPVKWAEMSQYGRWSTMYNVRSFIAKLRSFGYELRWDGKRMILNNFKSGSVEECDALLIYDEKEGKQEDARKLEEIEHVRWMTEALTKGFRPTTEEEHSQIESGKQTKDNLKLDFFAHDDIRPFSELDKKTQDYDVEMTKALVEALNEKLGAKN